MRPLCPTTTTHLWLCWKTQNDRKSKNFPTITTIINTRKRLVRHPTWMLACTWWWQERPSPVWPIISISSTGVGRGKGLNMCIRGKWRALLDHDNHDLVAPQVGFLGFNQSWIGAESVRLGCMPINPGLGYVWEGWIGLAMDGSGNSMVSKSAFRLVDTWNWCNTTMICIVSISQFKHLDLEDIK